MQSQRQNFVDAVVTVSYNRMLHIPTRRRSTSRAVKRTKRGRLLKTPPDASGSIATLQTYLLRKLLEDIHHQRTTPEEGLEVLRHLPYEDLDLRKSTTTGGYGKDFLKWCSVRARRWNKCVRLYSVSGPLVAMCSPPAPVNMYSPPSRTSFQRRCIMRPGTHHRHAIWGASPYKRYGAGRECRDVRHSCAEEAGITAETLGSTTERLYDVGVAGIHRLLDRREKLFRHAY